MESGLNHRIASALDCLLERGVEIMFCSKCGAEISSHSVYCWKCGAKINLPSSAELCLSPEIEENLTDSMCRNVSQNSEDYLKTETNNEVTGSALYLDNGYISKLDDTPSSQTEAPFIANSQTSESLTCKTPLIIDSSAPSKPITFTEIDDYPAIKNWESAPGYSFLGFLFSLCISAAVLFACVVFGVSIYVGNLIIQLICLIYSVSFYPSYFGKEPILKSSKAISFWNYATCGLIFGFFYNSNLWFSNKKRSPKKGIANIVAIVLSLIVCLPAIGVISSGSRSFANNDYSHSASLSAAPKTTNVDSFSDQSNPSRYYDKSTDVSFIIPDGWHEVPLSKDDYEYLRWKATTDDVMSANLSYAFDDIRLENTSGITSVTDFNGEDIEALLKAYRSIDPNASVEIVNLGDYSYLKSSMTMMYSGSYSARNVTFFTIHDGCAFSFMLIGDEIDSEEYDALEELVESVSFE